MKQWFSLMLDWFDVFDVGWCLFETRDLEKDEIFLNNKKGGWPEQNGVP